MFLLGRDKLGVKNKITVYFDKEVLSKKIIRDANQNTAIYVYYSFDFSVCLKF